MVFRKFFYYVQWCYKAVIQGKKIPLNSSIILTDKCNLNCKHCSVANLGNFDPTFIEVKRDIQKLYDTGSRMLIITGGEPFLWTYEKHSLKDVIQFARELGFFRIVVCTNGTVPLDSAADYLWVSLDGMDHEHNAIRGDIYNKVIENITNSRHSFININYTISSLNSNNFLDAAEQILQIKNVKGIFFHLFTPYLNSDKELLLTKDQKSEVIAKMLQFKKKYPLKVVNTYDGIKALQKDNWQRPVWSSITSFNGEQTECCCRRGIYDEYVCQNCGCSPAAETWVLQTLKPLAILENFRYL